jgi:hypothetical protein
MSSANLTKTDGGFRSSSPYSSRIIKAGALIGDTKTLLAHWDIRTSVDENLDRVRRDNVFGKASRSRVEDILAIFGSATVPSSQSRKHLSRLFKRGFLPPP